LAGPKLITDIHQGISYQDDFQPFQQQNLTTTQHQHPATSVYSTSTPELNRYRQAGGKPGRAGAGRGRPGAGQEQARNRPGAGQEQARNRPGAGRGISAGRVKKNRP
jgi:hypothetical protein